LFVVEYLFSNKQGDSFIYVALS